MFFQNCNNSVFLALSGSPDSSSITCSVIIVKETVQLHKQPFLIECYKKNETERGQKIENAVLEGSERGIAGRAAPIEHVEVENGVSWLEYEDLNNLALSTDSSRPIGTGFMATETSASLDSSLAKVVLKSGFIASENTVQTKRGHSLDKLNCSTLEKKQLKKLMLNVGMKVMSTGLLDNRKRLATFQLQKGVPTKFIEELLALASQKRTMSTRTGDVFY